MQEIQIDTQKGGTGKSTLARNLSVVALTDGRNVLYRDLDPQGSLIREWRDSREADTPAMLDRDPPPHVPKPRLMVSGRSLASALSTPRQPIPSGSQTRSSPSF